MARTGRFNRRSFLAQVIGGGAGGALLVVAPGLATAAGGEPTRRLMVDSDPGDPGREPPSSTSGTSSNAASEPRARTGVTDSDTGANADPVGYGRGGRRSGVSDSDSGASADAAGRGRGHPRASNDAPQPAPPAAANSAPLESFIICPGHSRCPH